MLNDYETFVLRPGLLWVILLSETLGICAGVFLFMAAVAVAIRVDSLLAFLSLNLA